jgi:hypothetical protein
MKSIINKVHQTGKDLYFYEDNLNAMTNIMVNKYDQINNFFNKKMFLKTTGITIRT